ncbi:MAG: hypothetical protein Q8O79_09540 [Pseudomonadota bacterium]|nr:hypothetical protein [Pseudomonadota bacterium]
MKIQRWLLMAAGLLASAAQAENPAPAVGLKPDQIQSIRAIGRAVLTAKKAQAADPAMAELRQGVEELRALTREELSLAAMADVRMDAVSAPRISRAGPASTLASAVPPAIVYPAEHALVESGSHKPLEASAPIDREEIAAPFPSTQDNRLAPARSRLAAVAERRSRVQTELNKNPDGKSALMVKPAVSRLEGLEQELDVALAEAPQTRRQHLIDLRQRLEPRSLDELLRLVPGQGPQPTLTTRVRHVAPVDSEASVNTEPTAIEPKKLKIKKPNTKNKRR